MELIILIATTCITLYIVSGDIKGGGDMGGGGGGGGEGEGVRTISIVREL
jgi:hypothetical protein